MSIYLQSRVLGSSRVQVGVVGSQMLCPVDGVGPGVNEWLIGVEAVRELGLHEV